MATSGACLEPCRRRYRLADVETGEEPAVDNEYLMSPKDLKTIHFLDRMIAAGARALKIEGCARPPEYVAARFARPRFRSYILPHVDDAFRHPCGRQGTRGR